MKTDPGFKGNKAFLDSKPCAQCGRTMTWRKRWALNWDTVKYCSDACRRDAARRPASEKTVGSSSRSR
jgi:hypothetical protein